MAQDQDGSSPGRERPSSNRERPSPNREASPGAPDSLLACLVRLSRELGRPLGAIEIVAAATGGLAVALAEHWAPRLGYRAAHIAPDPRTLAKLPAPFLLIGREGMPTRLVLGRDGQVLTLYDPSAEADLVMGLSEALEAAAAVLLLTPDDDAARPGWRSLFLGKVRRVLVEVAVASTAINLLALAAPLFTMAVYNKVIAQHAVSTLEVLALGMLAVHGFDAALRAIRSYVASHTGARLDAFLGGEAVHRLLALPYQQLEATTTGLIAERLNQVEVLRGFFAGQMPLLVADLAFVLLFVAALAFIHPLMALAVVAAMPALAAVSAVLHRPQRRLIDQAFAARAGRASMLAEAAASVLTIKALGLEPEIERRWGQRLALAAWTGYRSAALASMARVATGFLYNLLALAILFVGARLVMAGELSLGALIGGAILAQRAVAPIGGIAASWRSLQEVAAAFRRLDQLLGDAGEATEGRLSPAPRLAGRVVVEGLSFAPSPDRPPVLRNITLSVEPGTILGIIGPTGSGKSTLLRLIEGLQRPTSGRVLLDGADVAHLSPATLRRQIGVVPQEVQLFAASVRDNIAIGASERDPDRIAAIARFVGAHDFIERLPQGYGTVLGERGTGLSAGQRQLITLARALIRNPRLILLDEATSALDQVAEETLLRNLRMASRGRTVILVTHRLQPLAFCDRVALLIEGAIDRVGAPAEVTAFARARLTESTAPA
jgi:ABC-type bacteriocin/lantibiotic exporter with double-glycine peptidase domain